jgi:uncharacterized phage infection (PIP) family protein YhgE
MDSKALGYIQDIARLVKEASKVPLTNKAIVDEDRIYDILAQLEMEYTNLMKEQKAFTELKNNIIAQAEAEAKNILAKAQDERRELLTEVDSKVRGMDIYKESERQASLYMEEQRKVYLAEKERLEKELAEIRYQTFAYLHSVVNQINTIIPDIKKNVDEINIRLDLSEKSLGTALEDLKSNL